MIERGQMYRALESGVTIAVRRVAKDGSWADIEVHSSATTLAWRKRQKLRNGRFPYAVEPYSAGASSSAGSVPPAPPPAAR